LIFKQNTHRKWFATVYLVLFFLLEIMIMTNNSLVQSFDTSIQNFFQNNITMANTQIFTKISFLGSPMMDIIYLVLIMVLLFWKNKKSTSLWVGFVLVGGNIISFLVKITVKRQRPLEKVIPASGYSFPSGHVFGTTLLVLTLIILVLPYLKKQLSKNILKTLLIVWLIIVAISRVYLRGHFPSDVIGSALLAGTWWEYSELLYIRYYDSLTSFLKLNSK